VSVSHGLRISSSNHSSPPSCVSGESFPPFFEGRTLKTLLNNNIHFKFKHNQIINKKIIKFYKILNRSVGFHSWRPEAVFIRFPKDKGAEAGKHGGF